MIGPSHERYRVHIITPTSEVDFTSTSGCLQLHWNMETTVLYSRGLFSVDSHLIPIQSLLQKQGGEYGMA